MRPIPYSEATKSAEEMKATENASSPEQEMSVTDGTDSNEENSLSERKRKSSSGDLKILRLYLILIWLFMRFMVDDYSKIWHLLIFFLDKYFDMEKTFEHLLLWAKLGHTITITGGDFCMQDAWQEIYLITLAHRPNLAHEIFHLNPRKEIEVHKFVLFEHTDL